MPNPVPNIKAEPGFSDREVGTRMFPGAGTLYLASFAPLTPKTQANSVLFIHFEPIFGIITDVVFTL